MSDDKFQNKSQKAFWQEIYGRISEEFLCDFPIKFFIKLPQKSLDDVLKGTIWNF